MTKRTLSILLLTFTTTAAGMTACAPRQESATPPPTAPATVKATTPTPPAEAPTLGGLLARERDTRSHATPAVEQVATALERAGVPLSPMKQVLARTVGARYCAASTTTAGLAVAVCEFGSDAEAASGLAFSHRTFDPLIPGRSLTRNGATVLTLTPASSTANVHAQAERAAATFATL